VHEHCEKMTTENHILLYKFYRQKTVCSQFINGHNFMHQLPIIEIILTVSYSREKYET